MTPVYLRFPQFKLRLNARYAVVCVSACLCGTLWLNALVQFLMANACGSLVDGVGLLPTVLLLLLLVCVTFSVVWSFNSLFHTCHLRI
jgi:hypothetical protein